MSRYSKSVAYFSSAVATALLGAASLMPTSAAFAACIGPGAPDSAQTECVTAMSPGHPVLSFDISWADPKRAEYYLSDRGTVADPVHTAGIDIFDTQRLKFKRTIPGFKGIVLSKTGAVDNNHSGPAGVVSHGRWLYAGDGDSTLKVIDLDAPTASAIKQTIATGGTTRVDEMALTGDGLLLLAANNAEDPPFATLLASNGDAPVSNTFIIAKISVSPTIIPAGFGLSLEQPAWDPATQRFYNSIPTIANNPPGCVLGGTPACSGGVLVIDPDNPIPVLGAFDPVSGQGVIPLPACGPNGATVGVNGNLLLGCTPGNYPPGTTTVVINGRTHNTASVNGITGSDEVFFNAGDSRYYLAASGAKPTDPNLGRGSVLGVVDGTSVLIETIPQSSGSHSVAADSKRNLIFVPNIYTRPAGTIPAGDANTIAGGTATVGELLCGTQDGCIAVYRHNVDRDHDEDAPPKH
jgi:hypothetical protein